MSAPSPDRGFARLPAATPKVASRSVARYWESAFKGLDAEAFAWGMRLANKKKPLKPGEAARLRAFITTMRALGADESVAQIAAAAQARFVQAAFESMKEAAAYIPGWAEESAMSAASDLGWKNVPNPGAVAAAASGQVGWLTADFQNLTAMSRQFLVGQLTVAVAAGEGPRDLAKRIRAVVDTDARRGQARSMMIARTTLARVYDLSSQEVYKQAEELGVIQSWRWVASPGACDVCAALNGMVFPVGVDTYRHPNCRCTMTPVTKASEAYGTPFGDRFDPFPDTEDLVGKLEIVKSPSGWWNWRVKPKHVRVKRQTLTLREMLGKEPKQPVKPAVAKAARVKAAPEPKRTPQASGVRDVPTTTPAKHGYDYWRNEDRYTELAEWSESFKSLGYFQREQDTIMKNIMKRQGFDGLPTVVDDATFAALRDDGLEYIGRGITGETKAQVDDFVRQFQTGDDVFIGPKGMFGNGVYGSPNEDVLKHFSTMKADGSTEGVGHGGVMDMLLKPDAKVVDWEDANMGWMRAQEGRNQYYKTYGDPIYAFVDAARWAAMNGYDAIKVVNPVVGGETVDGVYWVILNRTALVVREGAR